MAIDEQANSLVVGDLDIDGLADIVVAYAGKPEVDVIRSNGDFDFAGAVSVPVATSGRVRRAPDLDNDGLPDLLVIPNDTESIGVIFSDP